MVRIRKLLLIFALALLIGVAGAAQIQSSQFNWTSVPASSVKSSMFDWSSVPAGTITQDKLSSSAGVMPCRTFIRKTATKIIEYNMTGYELKNLIISTANVSTVLQDGVNRGGLCILANGTYDMGTNYITMPATGSNVTVKGMSVDSTTIKGAGTYIIYYPTTTGARRTGMFRDLTIDGTSDTAIRGVFVKPTYCDSEILDNVRIVDCLLGICVNDSSSLSMGGVQIHSCANGIKLFTTSTSTSNTKFRFTDFNISSTTNQAIYIEGNVLGAIFSNGVIKNAGAPNMKIYSSWNTYGKPCGNVFENICFEEDGSDDMIQFDGDYGSEGYGPQGNIVRSCYFKAASNLQAVYILSGNKNVIVNNIAHKDGGSGTITARSNAGGVSQSNLFAENSADATASWSWALTSCTTDNNM